MIRRPAGAKERGAVLIVTTLLLTAVLGMTAILVDLGQVRSTTRLDQSVADLAALAAGKWLSQKNPAAACQDAVTYLNANANLSPTINAVNFCAQSGNDVNKTTCSSGSLTEAKPSATVGRYSVSIHYPVPDSEIADTNVSGGAHANDGVPCERMRVVISATDSRIFGGVLGGGSLATTRSATVRPSIAKSKLTPALWLLDPTGCTALSVSGGSQLTIGTTSPGIVQGVVTVDSDGSTCSSNQDTVSVSGAGTFLKAVPTTPPPSPDQDKVGTVELLALPIGATTCVDPACNSADVTAGRLSPQPVPEGERGTRGPVDWVYNCKSGYPAYHGINIAPCPTDPSAPDSGKYAYIDKLKTAVKTSGAPDATYQQWSLTHSCNPSGTTTVTGNWWVDCGNFSIGNGTTVDFAGGNVVFDGTISMSGSGVLRLNDANPNSVGLPVACTPAGGVTTPCIDSSSTNAAIVYLRNGDMNFTGGTFNAQHVTVVQNGGVVKVAGGAPPTWLAATEGPFAQLGLWSETSSNKYQINGGAGVLLSGVFFTPEASPFSLSGGGDWGQQDAQFISYHFSVSGGGLLTMAPDAQKFIQPPSNKGSLIR
ncbi:MAG TPA: Tad domain-containing protein [Acidimicrobiia bacterium]|nr:Tad domain-containing protein [Acidimicrobiia bacterium]